MVNPDTIVGQLTTASYAILGVTLAALAAHYWRGHRKTRRAKTAGREDGAAGETGTRRNP